ncbi:MAG: Transcriptional repressor NrdR [candidate division WS2 bacterium ADurb.Bin280]|uniref:Transcriptional repressor NrdR n=1 Tax=candidate division WS2 bacterium ADurb.Bin280 TaxID=1852829 RepID=A0A1V5SFE4_9BACT|nr:MAG: Transcriptional repressor NrdR [candidate division WS2 bacterium ADurb.Bin280]
MLCPKCKSDEIQVVDSRDVDEKTIRRRRECEACKFRFTSYERIQPIKLTVIKSDGKTENFDRSKIIRGIEIASNNRLKREQIEKIADEVEAKITQESPPQVTTKKIGSIVIRKLKKMDEVSYLRFASVYKNFQDIDSFEQELEKLKK